VSARRRPAARPERGARAPRGRAAAGGPRPPAAPAAFWLLKTDPESFSFDDLWAAPRRTSGWDGVRNHLAKLFLRDQMRVGDLALVHHSSCEQPGIVGVARIASPAAPDPTQFDARDEHFDRKSRREEPTWWQVDVQALARCPRPVPLAALRAEPALSGMALLQRGQRLSVQPVLPAEFAAVLRLSGLAPRELGL
jgi:predicted RNA-binding protein with PUA-like domain